MWCLGNLMIFIIIIYFILCGAEKPCSKIIKTTLVIMSFYKWSSMSCQVIGCIIWSTESCTNQTVTSHPLERRLANQRAGWCCFGPASVRDSLPESASSVSVSVVSCGVSVLVSSHGGLCVSHGVVLCAVGCVELCAGRAQWCGAAERLGFWLHSRRAGDHAG